MSTLRVVLQNKVGMLQHHHELPTSLTPLRRMFVEALERLANFVKSRPDILNDPSRWIRGMGWDQNLWSPSEYPCAVSVPSI